MTNPEFQTVPAWFMTEIASGLQAVYALCPEGTPGADVLQATIGVWARDLWSSRKRSWHRDSDTPCIRFAFAQIRQNSTRWPTPTKFWEALPDRKPPSGNKALMDPNAGRENEDEALRLMRERFRDWGVEDKIPGGSLR